MPSAASRAGISIPAVTVGLMVAGRFDAKDLIPYVVAQVIGAIVASAVL